MLSDLETESMGSNPNRSKVVIFFWRFLLPPLFLSLPTVCTLSLTMLVGTCFSIFTTGHGGGGSKREESQKNSSSAMCEASTDIRAMCGKREREKLKQLMQVGRKEETVVGSTKVPA